ncbi:hypothetical protein HYPSUDRAFT_196145 [Hypholoma sublateritium FD-334 SS-4]|uniref:PIN domain-containing protein n=1 Tax=Hypholoma sublateritium (strain FD-334 SS-4) TaxID=945553 RepID=A0A0D2PNN8_HYPSF|nr:hypothetical protein HYPSUDRAFT_196145 [Hypholoma sublateritium FD-334 SS-4]
MPPPAAAALPNTLLPGESGTTQPGTPPRSKYKMLLDSAIVVKSLELSHWFGVLQACDYFRLIPEQELLEFTRDLANSLDMHRMKFIWHDLSLWEARTLYLTKIIQENATKTFRLVEEEVNALNARAYAFGNNVEKSGEYILQHMKSEGCRKVVSQDGCAARRLRPQHALGGRRAVP